MPELGCDLFGDDAVDRLLTYAPSKLAFGALQSARDHLGAFHDHVEHGSLHPFANRTLLRTAIASAANAVWVLEPNESAQRVMRARMLAVETTDYHLGFLKNSTTHVGLSAEDRDHNEKLFSAAAQTRDTLNEIRRRDGQTQKFKQTPVIAEAVRARLGEDLVSAARAEWQRGSGAAHGLLWSVFGSTSMIQDTPPDDAGVAGFRVQGDFESIAEAHHLAYLLSSEGWSLLDQRTRVAGRQA